MKLMQNSMKKYEPVFIILGMATFAFLMDGSYMGYSFSLYIFYLLMMTVAFLGGYYFRAIVVHLTK
tara:strand:- start:719 stop:916 length:198 start_codon:yes stop_codon:yes gene_type:complete